MFQKKFPAAVLFAVAFLLVFGAGGLILGKYFYGSKLSISSQHQISPVPTETPILTPDLYTEQSRSATANWKIYTNTKYGFSIKYPSSWILNEGSQPSFWVGIESIKGISAFQTSNPNEDEKSNGFFDVGIRENNAKLSLKDWFDTTENCGTTQSACAPSSPKFNKLYMIGDKQVLLADTNLPGPLSEGIEVYYFANGSGIYQLNFHFPTDPKNKQLFKELYNQILSTFRFLDQISPTATP